MTDLKMPGCHGYQFACDLLDRDDRPMVVVLTGVLEPRLAKALYARGVDHIEFKPVDYGLFATKVKSLLVRQMRANAPRREFCENVVVSTPELSHPATRSAKVTVCEVESKLKHLAGMFPMSQAALDVVDVAQADNSTATKIASAIARDACLAVEVLRRANSSFYNPSGERIVSLEQAVVRIGTRRVSELALATTVLTSLTDGMLPWMDVDLAWRRSIAAGRAVDALVDAANLGDEHESLFLCALLHGLGRIALGTLFPDQYRSMIEQCRVSCASLLHLEREVFPETAVKTMLRLLSIWNVPTAAREPLKHLSDDYAALSCLDELTRRKVELLKLGVLIGQLAIGEWEPWDLVELSPASVMERLKVAASVSEVVGQTKADLFEVVNFRKHPPHRGDGAAASKNLELPRISYRKSPSDHFDFLREILRCMNVVPVSPESTEVDPDEPILINRLEVVAMDCAAMMNDVEIKAGKRLIVVEADKLDPLNPLAKVIRLPCSFAALHLHLQDLLQP